MGRERLRAPWGTGCDLLALRGEDVRRLLHALVLVAIGAAAYGLTRALRRQPDVGDPIVWAR